jgi:uncharacterized protein (TIGR02266 family)
VLFPVLVSFDTGAFTVRDYIVNLSEGGIYLHTETLCEVGARGTLKFRHSRFERPLTLLAEVVRTVAPGEETHGQRCGMGLRFIDPKRDDLDRLREIVDGVRSGSVVATIRQAIRESGLSADVALRNLPTDQKMMLSLHARGTEIGTLIRDGVPSVVIRLLDCPQLRGQHVQLMLRGRNLPTRVLTAIRKEGKWLANEECRWLFCTHPSAMLPEVIDEMRKLPPARLAALERTMSVRPQVRMKTQELNRRRKRLGRRGS